MLQGYLLESDEPRPDLLVWFMRGGLVGITVSVGMFLLSLVPVLGDAEWFQNNMELFWPASSVLVAEPHGLMAILLLAVALGFNFVAYGLVALLLAVVMRLLHNLRTLRHS
jgi:hypothetical protein